MRKTEELKSIMPPMFMFIYQNLKNQSLLNLKNATTVVILIIRMVTLGMIETNGVLMVATVLAMVVTDMVTICGWAKDTIKDKSRLFTKRIMLEVVTVIMPSNIDKLISFKTLLIFLIFF